MALLHQEVDLRPGGSFPPTGQTGFFMRPFTLHSGADRHSTAGSAVTGGSIVESFRFYVSTDIM